MQCKAITVTTNERCKRSALEGDYYCSHHALNGQSGFRSTNLKSGRYSKYLPENIRADYETLLNDPDILSLENEIALMQSVLGRKVDEIAAGGTKNNWNTLQDYWSELMMAITNGDSRAQTDCILRIDEFLHKAEGEQTVTTEIRALTDSIRKLSESEQRRRVQNETMMGVERVMILMYSALQSLKDAAYLHAPPDIARKIIATAEKKHNELIGRGNPVVEIAGDVVGSTRHQ